jgi:hypothetical protein
MIQGWYDRPVVAAVPKVPPHRFKKKIFFREIGQDIVDWIDLAQGRDQCMPLVNTVMNLWVP